MDTSKNMDNVLPESYKVEEIAIDESRLKLEKCTFLDGSIAFCYNATDGKRQFSSKYEYMSLDNPTYSKIAIRYFPDGKLQIYADYCNDGKYHLDKEYGPDGKLRRNLTGGNQENGLNSLPGGIELIWNGVTQNIKSLYIRNDISREWCDRWDETVKINGRKTYVHCEGYRRDKIPGKPVCEYGYDASGKVILHATDGKDDTDSYLKAQARKAELEKEKQKHRLILRKMVAKKIDKRDANNPNEKKYKRLIRNKTMTKAKIVVMSKVKDLFNI